MSRVVRNERGLDHMVVAVPDLDAAITSYRALGFTTTPKAMHPWGTGNSLVQLDRSFFELLSVEQPSQISPAAAGEFSFGHYNQRFLASHRHGMSMLVFSTDDAAADRARWAAAGLDVYAPFDFARRARLPDGGEVTVAFSLAFVTHEEMPWASWFVCQQHAPEHFWKPDYQRHENGAQSLARVIMLADEPARFHGFLDALFDEGQIIDIAGGIALVLPYSRVEIVTPRHGRRTIPGLMDASAFVAHGPRFVAASVEVADLGVTRARLADASANEDASGLWISADAACGLHLQLCEGRSVGTAD